MKCITYRFCRTGTDGARLSPPPVYSGQNVVEEYDSNWTRRHRFIHGPTYIDERAVMTEFDPNDPGTGLDYVYLMKDLYMVAGLADFKALLVESYDYDAYGKVTPTRHACFPYCCDLDGDGDVDDDDNATFLLHVGGSGAEPNGFAGWRSDFDCDGDVDAIDGLLYSLAHNGPNQPPDGDETLMSNALATSRVGNPYYFTGRRLDQRDFDDNGTSTVFTDDTYHLQLYHYRARTYEPVTGRFLQRDPAGYVDGMSLYEYVRSRTTALTDPRGKCTLGSKKAAIGTAVVIGGLAPDEAPHMAFAIALAELRAAGYSPGSGDSPPISIPDPMFGDMEVLDLLTGFSDLCDAMEKGKHLSIWYKWKCEECMCILDPHLLGSWPFVRLYRPGWKTTKISEWKRCKVKWGGFMPPGYVVGSDVKKMAKLCQEEGNQKAKTDCGI